MHVRAAPYKMYEAPYIYPPVPLMPDLVYQYSCTRILDLQYSTVVLGSYTAVQHRSYCITVLAVRILLYELYSTVLYCTTSIDTSKAEFWFGSMIEIGHDSLQKIPVGIRTCNTAVAM